jgi:hypothetical protein
MRATGVFVNLLDVDNLGGWHRTFAIDSVHAAATGRTSVDSGQREEQRSMSGLLMDLFVPELHDAARRPRFESLLQAESQAPYRTPPQFGTACAIIAASHTDSQFR